MADKVIDSIVVLLSSYCEDDIFMTDNDLAEIEDVSSEDDNFDIGNAVITRSRSKRKLLKRSRSNVSVEAHQRNSIQDIQTKDLFKNLVANR